MASFFVQQSVTGFFRAISLQKHYPEHFRRYFTTCSEVIAGQKDTIFLLHFLLAFLIYWAVLQLVFAYAPDHLLSKFTRAVLIDVVLILNVQPKFSQKVYVCYAILIFYSVYLHWSLYFRANKFRLNILGVEANLVVGSGQENEVANRRSRKYNREFGSNGQRRRRRSTVISMVDNNCDDKVEDFEVENMEKVNSTSNGIDPFDTSFKSRYNRVKTYRDLDWALYRKQALCVVNFLQIFTVFMDLSLVGFMALLLSHLYRHWTPEISPLFTTFLLFHLPFLLIHVIFFLAFWTSFEATISFLASYSMVGIIYIQLTCHRNYDRLKKELQRTIRFFRKVNEKEKFGGDAYDLDHHHGRLMAILRSNLHLFEVIFFADQFYSQVFTVYLIIFLPASAYVAMGVLSGKLGTGLFSFVLLGVVLGNTAVGSLAIHAAITHLSGVMHRGGKMLAVWSAKAQSGKNKEGDDNDKGGVWERSYRPLPPRLVIHLNTLHISRLLVHHQYGPTYYIIGALITMKSLVECILLWGEFVMYAHALVRNE
ncbi:hypothetical protein TYRP_023537 [Tyrophagus putrescentiae]|nr:hypothetical protein TYRP_023537 [Tyrophagus putrescentiae]